VRAAVPIVLAALLAGPAYAELSGNIAVVSDYRFRGISQSDRGPALQGSVAYDHPTGLFAGLFASTVAFDGAFQADVETFLQAGFARRLHPDLSAEVGAGCYAYPGANLDWNYCEGFLGVTWREATARAYYAPDYLNRGARVAYAEVNVTHPLSERTALVGHLGFWRSEGGTRVATPRSRLDVRVGVAFDLGVANLEISAVATDIPNAECPAGSNNCQLGAVVAVSRSF
jgi:uncharacterized protein (TIGR02001 family)